jgi:hypothetical protein
MLSTVFEIFSYLALAGGTFLLLIGLMTYIGGLASPSDELRLNRKSASVLKSFTGLALCWMSLLFHLAKLTALFFSF